MTGLYQYLQFSLHPGLGQIPLLFHFTPPCSQSIDENYLPQFPKYVVKTVKTKVASWLKLKSV